MDDLLAEFVAEAHDMLDALAGEIVAWEADPTDCAKLDSIFRFFHTVKGNCGFFDFPRLEALSHAAEDVLADVRKGRRKPDSALVDAVLAVIDKIAEMIAVIEDGQKLPDASDDILIAALQVSGGVIGAEHTTQTAEAEDAAPRANGNGNTGGKRTIRLPVELLDRIMSGVSDMALARNDLINKMQGLDGVGGLQAPFNRLSGILEEVREAITRTRMQRIESLFSAFPRLVRDLSAELGKQVMVEIQGGDVELDREMIELIRDPLVHCIRNSIDHGIETPAERIAAGKREIGLLSISARQSGNEIRIGISDDGRGIDTDKAVKKAIAAGILTEEEAAALTTPERNMLICEAGLSTADEVTAVSGRGVGMDVVRDNIEKIGGKIDIYTLRGVDTRILLTLPLTLSIVPALTVGVGGQRFALPRSYIEEVFQAGHGEGELVYLAGKPQVLIRGKRIPCADLNSVLGMEERPIRAGTKLVVARLMVGDPFALAVDEVYDHQELVIKPVAPAIMQAGFYVGTTQMDDGSPVLMLDVTQIAEMAGLIHGVEQGSLRQYNRFEEEAEAKPTVPVLLFRSLDGKRRAIGMNAVVRVEKVAVENVRWEGNQSKVVIDDRITPLAGTANGQLPEKELEIFRLGDGQAEIAYAIGEMIDIAEFDGEIVTQDCAEGIAGLALIGGETTEIVDCHALFCQYARMAEVENPPVCRMPVQDRWFQEFLRPMVEAAGYRVVGEDTNDTADIAIAARADSGQAEIPVKAARAIWLRSTPAARPDQGETIYRYDRTGLIAALQAAKAGGS